jgi:hypothetical protein
MLSIYLLSPVLFLIDVLSDIKIRGVDLDTGHIHATRVCTRLFKDDVFQTSEFGSSLPILGYILFLMEMMLRLSGSGCLKDINFE